jgi:signal transduction histidine kinase
VHGIIHQASGFIDVVSDPDRGTSFLLYFPRAA